MAFLIDLVIPVLLAWGGWASWRNSSAAGKGWMKALSVFLWILAIGGFLSLARDY